MIWQVDGTASEQGLDAASGLVHLRYWSSPKASVGIDVGGSASGRSGLEHLAFDPHVQHSTRLFAAGSASVSDLAPIDTAEVWTRRGLVTYYVLFLVHHSTRAVHIERPHQGLENQLIETTPPTGSGDRIVEHERLGGLLRSYERAA